MKPSQSPNPMYQNSLWDTPEQPKSAMALMTDAAADEKRFAAMATTGNRRAGLIQQEDFSTVLTEDHGLGREIPIVIPDTAPKNSDDLERTSEAMSIPEPTARHVGARALSPQAVTNSTGRNAVRTMNASLAPAKPLHAPEHYDANGRAILGSRVPKLS